MSRRDHDAGTLTRGMRVVWPSVSLALAVVVAAAPGAESGVPVAALMPVAVIYFWSIRRGAILPSPVVFGCGVMLDAVSHGPAGYWALVYLSCVLLARTVGEFANGGAVARTAMLVACLVLAVCVQAAVMAAYRVELAQPGAMVVAGAVIVVCYPLIAWVLSTGAAPGGMGDGLRFTPQGHS